MNFPSKPSPCVGIRTCSDYSPFGVELDGRTVSGGYRFGYQGSEKDNELKGDGNSYTTEFRQLDPRLGRWLSVDPVIQPWQSSYCLMDDNPISLNDKVGLSTQDWIGKKTADGKTINWEYNKDVKSADQLPDGYTEFLPNGSTVQNKSKDYLRLLENKTLILSEIDFKASKGVFEPGKYYRVGQYGWEESGMMFLDAVTAEMAATAEYITGQIAGENLQEDFRLSQARMMRPLMENQQQQLEYDFQQSQNIFGLMYQLSPASSFPDVVDNLREENYWTAGGIVALELTPWDDLSGAMAANRKAFRQFKAEYGSAGPNMDWHHLVEQNSVNVARFGPAAIQNSTNLIRLNRELHWQVTAHYNSAYLGSGFSRNRDYVNSLSFTEQRSYAVQLLRDLGY